jgi:DNA-binding phage protein
MAKKTKVERLTNYDPAEDLGSDEAIAIFMAEAFQTNDAGYISHALEQLYRSFSEKGNPTLKTTLAVMKALGIELTAKVAAAA